VLVLFRGPKGADESILGLPLSLSLSSRLGPKLSLWSVLRLRRDGDGEEMLDSSLENLLLLGDTKELLDWKRSAESLLLPAGRVDGESPICDCVTEVLRFTVALLGVLSLFCAGGFKGELTEVEKAFN